MVTDMRRTNQLKVAAGIESFTKRSAIRRLDDTAGFTKDEVAIIYDKFFGALYYAKQHGDRQETQLDIGTFHLLLESVTTWAKRTGQVADESSDDMALKRSLAEDFIHRLYLHFKSDSNMGVSFQDTVNSLSDILHGVRKKNKNKSETIPLIYRCIFLFIGFDVVDGILLPPLPIRWRNIR